MRTAIATRLALGVVPATAAFAAGSAEAEVTSNGASLNGTQLNGLSFNGMSFNGMSFNGVVLNGLRLNGWELNGGGDAAALRVKAVRLPSGRVLVSR